MATDGGMWRSLQIGRTCTRPGIAAPPGSRAAESGTATKKRLGNESVRLYSYWCLVCNGLFFNFRRRPCIQ
jgi:hypothetical protein